MKPRRTFAISLSLNLVLAGAAVYLVRKTDSPMPDMVAATVPRPVIAPAPPPGPAASNSPAPTAYVTNHFAWSKVEAEDFEQLALNLRAIGCPEKTVRDVVAARARRALQQIARASEPKLSFWAAGSRRARANEEAEHQAISLREKILARVERAVGPNGFLEETRETDEFEGQAIMRFVFGPLPEDTFYKVAAKLERFSRLGHALEARTRGVLLDADEAELATLHERYRHELATLLSPAQVEELTARMTMIPQMDRVKFEATDLTSAEVRQLALIGARFSDPLDPKNTIPGTALSSDPQAASLKEAQRQFLGEARFAQFERAADDDFKSLFELGRENQLPRDVTGKVFDLRQLSAQQVERLRQDKSLTNSDRKQRLDQMQAEVQQAVLHVLGANTTGQYLGGGGAWLTNLNGL